MADGFIIPYQTQRTNSRVWVAWWARFPRPPLALVVQNFGRADTIIQHTFGRNENGELIHYWWWTQQGWQAENLTRYARIGNAFRIASDPVAVNLQSGDIRTQHVFARNDSGDVIHYWWWAQEGWTAENLTQYPNIGSTFRIAGDPSVINLQSSDTPTQHVFARNNSGDLIHYWWSAQPGWKAENLTRYPNIDNAFRIAGDPSVINLRSGDTLTQHAFARNSAGDLIHYWWWAQQGWRAENLTQYPNIGIAQRIASDPETINLRDGARLTQHVFARNSAGDLIHYWWRDSEGWQAVNLTRTGFRIASKPAVIHFRDNTALTQHVFGGNRDGDLIHYWWRAQGGWRWENITTYPNIGTAFRTAGDPVAVGLQSGAALTQHVFARNSSGDLIHYWWWDQQGWRAENLTTEYPHIGTSYRIASDPVVLNLQSGDVITQHVFARSSAGEVIHYWWWAQQGWRAENLTRYRNIGSTYVIQGEPVAINFDVLREIPLLDGAWSAIGLEGPGPHEVVCQYQVVPLDGLEPAATYTMVLEETDTGETVTTGFVETLPDRLPPSVAAGLSQRPFTILLGSCYYAPADPARRVDQAYSRLWNSPENRPHLKILCGDQVYVDQPAGPPTMDERLSSLELRRWMIRKYRESWTSLAGMLQRGANYLTSDDHEYWNDYPERPVAVAWTALYTHLQYRRDWGREASAHFREIQQGSNVTRIDIGTELSIFIADTRVNRQRDGIHFMSADDFAAMIDWIRGLTMPGILVLGQPVLATPISRLRKAFAGHIISDRNLPYFVQYDDLVNALQWWCRHDVLILAGDIHCGRIAKFSLRAGDQYPVTAHEVISSGMTVLPGAENDFTIGVNGRAYPYIFPPYTQAGETQRGRGVRYKQAVPVQADRDGTENHFMTLQFNRHPRGQGIEVNIRAWLVDRGADGGLPGSAWTYTCALDAGHPLTRNSFGRNANSDLIHYWWWMDEGWKAENLTQYSNVGEAYRVASDPVVMNLWNQDTLELSQHVFGRNAASELIHYWWGDRDSWQAENLTRYPNIGNSHRIALPPVVTAHGSGDTLTQHAFALNASGDLIHYWWWAQGGWQAENLTQYPNIGVGFRMVRNPDVVSLQTGSTLTQHALAVNRLGDVIHYWWSAQQGWQAENLTEYPNVGNAYRIVLDPVVINLRSGDLITQHVFGRNGSGDLIHYWWWAQEGWQAENLTTDYANIGVSYRIVSNPVALNLHTDGVATQHVFGRNGAGDLIHYWWWAQEGWQAENLTTEYANIGTGFRIVSNPVVMNLHTGDVPTQHAFGRNANGDLIHYHWSAQQGWQAENLTTGYANIGTAYRIVSDPALSRFRPGEVPTQHALARNANSELIHYWWSTQGGWRAENLTSYRDIGSAFRIGGTPASASAYQDVEVIG